MNAQPWGHASNILEGSSCTVDGLVQPAAHRQYKAQQSCQFQCTRLWEAAALPCTSKTTPRTMLFDMVGIAVAALCQLAFHLSLRASCLLAGHYIVESTLSRQPEADS